MEKVPTNFTDSQFWAIVGTNDWQTFDDRLPAIDQMANFRLDDVSPAAILAAANDADVQLTLYLLAEDESDNDGRVCNVYADLTDYLLEAYEVPNNQCWLVFNLIENNLKDKGATRGFET